MINVKLFVTLVFSATVVDSQSTSSSRNLQLNDQCLQDVTFEIESFRRLLIAQQNVPVCGESQTLQKIKSQVEEIRQQNDNEAQATQEIKSQVEELQLQNRNESQTIHEMKSQVEEIRQQNDNEAQATQEIKSQVEELRLQNRNESQTIQEVKSQVEEIRQQNRNEAQTIQDIKSQVEEIRQQNRNEAQTIQEVKSQVEEIRQQNRNEAQTIQEMKSQVEEIRQIALRQQNQPRKDCPFGFEYLPEAGRCYKVIFETLNWYNASVRCQQVMPGVHLAAITSADENDAIVKFIQRELLREDKIRCYGRYYGYYVWLGGQRKSLSRCDDNYVWRTLNGIETPFNYTNWAPSQPDCFENNENCVHTGQNINYAWNDIPCDDTGCALCEI